VLVGVTAVLVLAAPAAAQADYGAIAVNTQTAAWGASHDYNRKGPALRRAQRECPGRCTFRYWVRNGCAAVVVNRTRFYAEGARTKRRAVRKARRSAPGPERLVAWTCSG
jgi:hypothetical protein